MSTHPTLSRLLSAGLIVSLPLLALPARSAGATATLSGSIVWAADQTPVAGSKLHAGDAKTGEIFSSAPAADNGSFALGDLPASTYELAVESNGGLYLVGTPLTLAPGTAQTLNLAVNRQSVPSYDEEEEDPDKKKGGYRLWDNPLLATLVIVGFVAVIGLLLDDDDSSRPPPVTSGSQPGG